MDRSESAAHAANLAEQRSRTARRAGAADATGWRWYISIAAIKNYMRIMDWPGPLEDENPFFRRAESELGAYSLTARLSNRTLPSGAVVYRSGRIQIPGRGSRRLDFVVVETLRAEGLLPQLVEVGTR
jgi:hypothetical protein